MIDFILAMFSFSGFSFAGQSKCRESKCSQGRLAGVGAAARDVWRATLLAMALSQMMIHWSRCTALLARLWSAWSDCCYTVKANPFILLLINKGLKPV